MIPLENTTNVMASTTTSYTLQDFAHAQYLKPEALIFTDPLSWTGPLLGQGHQKANHFETRFLGKRGSIQSDSRRKLPLELSGTKLLGTKAQFKPGPKTCMPFCLVKCLNLKRGEDA